MPGCKKTTISRQLLEIASDFSLEQIVSEPTRKNRILDICLISHPSLVAKNYMAPGVSDHDGMPIFELKTRPSKQNVKKRKIYLYKKANITDLTQEIKTVSDKVVEKISDFDKSTNNSVDDIYGAY